MLTETARPGYIYLYTQSHLCGAAFWHIAQWSCTAVVRSQRAAESGLYPKLCSVLSRCVSSSASLKLPKPQFPYLQNGDKHKNLRIIVMIKWIKSVKYAAQCLALREFNIHRYYHHYYYSYMALTRKAKASCVKHRIVNSRKGNLLITNTWFGNRKALNSISYNNSWVSVISVMSFTGH